MGGFRISFFSFFFLEKTGGISSEMGEPKLTAYLWYERKKKMTTQEQEGRMHVISSESKVAKNQKYSCRLQIPGISKWTRTQENHEEEWLSALAPSPHNAFWCLSTSMKNVSLVTSTKNTDEGSLSSKEIV